MSVTWHIKEFEECESTFNEARKLPPWSVVNCERQTRGRGRFNRAWFGSQGGLWATYNLPLDPKSPRHWGLLPLVAGAAIMEALKAYKIKGLRLRWPNDVLVGKAKLAGILVERPAATMVSIGIGINVFNDIQELEGKTQDSVVRLSDLVPMCPSIRKLRTILGDCLEEIFEYYCESGMEAIVPLLNQAWDGSRPVVAITDKERICGHFAGVEFDGSPIIRKADGSTITVPGITVNRMKELI